jgi:predicted DNA-binding protein (UPF0251 family)
MIENSENTILTDAETTERLNELLTRFTKKEVAELLDVSRVTLDTRLKRSKWKTTEKITVKYYSELL